MFSGKKPSTNWGRNIHINTKRFYPKNYNQLKKITNKKSFIVQGNQRSYGDVCLNNQFLISMSSFDKVKHFNKKKGIIEIESGLLLKDLLPIIIQSGWFIPITPGTKHVSIGGMIANNIHGKNTKKNQIKYYVKEIKILTLNKKIISCSRKKNRKIFNLTIGGYGLTGIILTTTLILKKIYSENIDQKIIEFENFKEFYSITKKNDKYEYSVCWVDNFNNNKIKGLYYLGNHLNTKEDKTQKNLKEKKVGLIVLLIFRIIISNFYFPKVMNFLFRKYKKFFYQKICHYTDFFYPQDHILDWNKLYGKKGFFQIQFIIPKNKFEKILAQISDFMNENKIFSCFIIIKKFNEKGKYLNFSGKGYSISFDFLIDKKFESLKLFLNRIFEKNKLMVNFSKDSITNKKNAQNYKEFNIFKRDLAIVNRQKKLNSLFSKRLNI